MLIVRFKSAEASDVYFLRLAGGSLYRHEHSLHCGGGCAACGSRTHIALNPGDELFLIHRQLKSEIAEGYYTCLKALTPHSRHCQVVPSSLVKMQTPPVATLMSCVAQNPA